MNGISVYFVYYKYMNHNKENVSVYDYVYHAKKFYYYFLLIIFTTTSLISKILIQPC